MLRITIDLLVDNGMDEELTAACNVAEAGMTQLQKEELFKIFLAARAVSEERNKPVTEDDLILHHPTFCEGCEE